MARCLRCKAGNEWIEGNVPPKIRDGAVWLPLTKAQADTLRILLDTHVKVTEVATARICRAIAKKLRAAASTRARNNDG